MMRRMHGVAMAGLLLTAGCVAPVGPVEVTRFHAADQRSELGLGSIRVQPADGVADNSIEFTAWRTAVEQELERLGYRVFNGREAGLSGQVASLRIERTPMDPVATRGPVSVGVGGSTGGWGSGVGVGLGFNLGGGTRQDVVTTMHVSIRHRHASTNLWEGRATMRVREGSAVSETPLAAGKLAAALFQGFPGVSGETIAVP